MAQENLTGGDTAQLVQMAGDTKRRGATVNAEALSITRELGTALDEFKNEMAGLLDAADLAKTFVNEEAARTATQVAETPWEGKNSQQFAESHQEFKTNAERSAQTLDELMVGAKRFVDTSFNSEIEELTKQTKAGGEASEACATQLGTLCNNTAQGYDNIFG